MTGRRHHIEQVVRQVECPPAMALPRGNFFHLIRNDCGCPIAMMTHSKREGVGEDFTDSSMTALE